MPTAAHLHASLVAAWGTRNRARRHRRESAGRRAARRVLRRDRRHAPRPGPTPAPRDPRRMPGPLPRPCRPRPQNHVGSRSLGTSNPSSRVWNGSESRRCCRPRTPRSRSTTCTCSRSPKPRPSGGSSTPGSSRWASDNSIWRWSFGFGTVRRSGHGYDPVATTASPPGPSRRRRPPGRPRQARPFHPSPEPAGRTARPVAGRAGGPRPPEPDRQLH